VAAEKFMREVAADVAVALGATYCCFTAALLLLYCCFTAALLLLYCCFTAALLLREVAAWQGHSVLVPQIF
jgi:hypothetical protein